MVCGRFAALVCQHGPDLGRWDFVAHIAQSQSVQMVNQVARAQQPAAGVQQSPVSGHTDRAGSAQCNVGLSQRRAETERQALAERGVPPGEIVLRNHTDMSLWRM